MFNNILLKNLRSKQGLTAESLVLELYKQANVKISRPTLINWEQGRSEPKASQAYLISKYFRKPMEKFFV